MANYKKNMSGAARVWKILGLLVLALMAWTGWCLIPPGKVAETPVQGKLPADFIWGVSSSGFQSEGGELDSNWHRLNKIRPTQDRYGSSVDFRHRYREDVALAKDLGVNTYRIGINWARVEPKKGQFDEAELAYYDDVIKAMKEAGIAPLITLDHFVYPGWVDDQGAWTNPQTVNDFVAYSRVIAQRYHADVRLWITFNEAAFFIAGDTSIRKIGFSGMREMSRNVIAAHRQVYDVIHGLDPKAMVTSNIVWLGDHFGSGTMQALSDWLFLDGVLDKCDTIAIDYYAADLVKAVQAKDKGLPPEPAGLYRGLMILKDRYPDKPILIAETGMSTENGQPRADGVKREEVLRDGIYWTQRAREDGANVVGYMVWSLTDNFEWGSYTPRFGLYTVNVLTDPALTRIPTAAVPAYKEIIRNGRVGADYLPVMPQ